MKTIFTHFEKLKAQSIWWLFASLFILVPTFLHSQFRFEEPSYDVVILLDRSESMQDTDPQGLSIAAAAYIAETVGMANPENRVAVVTFSSRADIFGPERFDTETILSAEPRHVVDWLSAGSRNSTHRFSDYIPAAEERSNLQESLSKQLKLDNFTELAPALQLADSILKNGTNKHKIIVLIGDGDPWPNYENIDRKRELSVLLGLSMDADNEAFKTAYKDYILEKIAPRLARENYTFYPMAFQDTNTPFNNFIIFLEDLQYIITGERNVIQTSSGKLTEEASKLIPSGMQHIRYITLENWNNTSAAEPNLAFNVPQYTDYTRIHISFKSSRPSQLPIVQLVRNNETILSTDIPVQTQQVAVHDFKNSQGALLSYTIYLKGSEYPSGDFTIFMTDGSVGTSEGVPEADLFVDFHSEADPLVEITPQYPIRARAKTNIRFRLSYTQNGESLIVPLEEAVIRLQGNGVAGRASKTVNSTSSENGIVEFNIVEGIELPGTYDVVASLFIKSPGPMFSQPEVFLQFPIQVTQGEPPTARFSRFGEPIAELPIGEIGDQARTRSIKFSVETDQDQLNSDLLVTISEMQHAEREVSLQSGYTNWVTLDKNTTEGLTRGNPVEFTLTAVLPDAFFETIPDGLYEGTLSITHQNRILQSIPVHLTLSVPRFIIEGSENLDVPTEAEVPVLFQEKIIRIPRREGQALNIPIRIQSTADNGTKLHAVIPSQQAREFKDEAVLGSNEDVVFTLPADTVDIPGDKKGRPANFKIQVQLQEPKELNNSNFKNNIIFQGPGHRSQNLEIRIHFNYLNINLLRTFFIVLFAIGIVLLFINRWKFNFTAVERIFNLRRYPGTELKMHQGKNGALSPFGEVEFNPTSQDIQFRAGSKWRIEPFDFADSEETTTIYSGDEIHLRPEGLLNRLFNKSFYLNIDDVFEDSDHISIRLIGDKNQPYKGFGGVLRIGLQNFLKIVFILISLSSIIFPYWIFQLIVK